MIIVLEASISLLTSYRASTLSRERPLSIVQPSTTWIMLLRSKNRSSLPMEIVPVLNMVDFSDELFLDCITCVKTVKGAAHHQLEIVVGLLNLCDVYVLEL